MKNGQVEIIFKAGEKCFCRVYEKIEESVQKNHIKSIRVQGYIKYYKIFDLERVRVRAEQFLNQNEKEKKKNFVESQ